MYYVSYLLLTKNALPALHISHNIAKTKVESRQNLVDTSRIVYNTRYPED